MSPQTKKFAGNGSNSRTYFGSGKSAGSSEALACIITPDHNLRILGRAG